MINNPLPPELMTSDKGSFAEKTIAKRKPSIINQILADFDFSPEIRQSLLEFKEEIATGTIRLLQESTSDIPIWERHLRPWSGKTWFQIPWLLAEAYFYRRVLECTHYFQPGPYQYIDPFQYLKTREIHEGLLVFESIYPSMANAYSENGFKAYCIKALWGNRGDLSHTEDKLDPSMDTQSHRILIDHSQQVFQFLSAIQPSKIAYFFDNVGKELLFDLAFIDYLLQTGLAGQVTCILKNQPFFVSDSMPKDLFETVDCMITSNDDQVQQLAARLLRAIKSSKIQHESPPFMSQPQTFHEMPTVLQKEISAHDFAILKGDVNYRRLIGDRHWQPTTPIEAVAAYFPTTFLSLRTLKAELVVGLTEEVLENVLKEADPDWLINGDRGLITFLKK